MIILLEKEQSVNGFNVQTKKGIILSFKYKKIDENYLVIGSLQTNNNNKFEFNISNTAINMSSSLNEFFSLVSSSLDKYNLEIIGINYPREFIKEICHYLETNILFSVSFGDFIEGYYSMVTVDVSNRTNCFNSYLFFKNKNQDTMILVIGKNNKEEVVEEQKEEKTFEFRFFTKDNFQELDFENRISNIISTSYNALSNSVNQEIYKNHPFWFKNELEKRYLETI